MLLTADIGNTNTVFGLWSNRELLRTYRVETSTRRTADEWHLLLHNWFSLKNNEAEAPLEAFSMCSVVPLIDEPLKQAITAFEVETVQQWAYRPSLPMRFLYDNPMNLGADRVVNAIAAASLFGENLIIADFGTAIKFCKVEDRTHCGGLILPGIDAALSGLALKTAQLPQISYDSNVTVCGTSTSAGIQAGIHYGYKGMLREIMSELKQTFTTKNQQTVKCIATGGVSHQIGYFHEFFDVVDTNLTLKGLRLLYDMEN